MQTCHQHALHPPLQKGSGNVYIFLLLVRHTGSPSGWKRSLQRLRTSMSHLYHVWTKPFLRDCSYLRRSKTLLAQLQVAKPDWKAFCQFSCTWQPLPDHSQWHPSTTKHASHNAQCTWALTEVLQHGVTTYAHHTLKEPLQTSLGSEGVTVIPRNKQKSPQLHFPISKGEFADSTSASHTDSKQTSSVLHCLCLTFVEAPNFDLW